ncbi:MAG: sigma-54-dependent transcriptional regulator [Candidatus Rokuibacteriota bacterium]
MTASILVVDDEPAIQDILTWALSAEGYRVATAGSGEEALTRVEEEDFDIIVTDIVMPGLDGLEVLERSRVLNPRAAVIVMTAYAALETAIAALRRGAADYLEKPFSVDLLKERVRRLLQYRETIWKDRLVQRALQPRVAGSLVGESDAIRALHEQITLAARTPSNVLITGESGAGKELVARAVHAEGARHDAAFVAINCGAIPEALLESQLFGHVRGAFTTAVQANQGLFVAANQGSLFLDEIGEMPLPLQVKLLRVIEDKCVLPVGGTKPLPVDTRIIASTNRDLEREVEAGRFREDLFYRLNVVHLVVPPLRERRGDIPVLVDHLVHRLNTKLGTRCLGVERDALWSLIGRPWKGNVRELENVLERAIVLGGNDLISMRDLSAEPATSQGTAPQDLRGAVRRFERQHLMEVLASTQSDKRKAARALGISLASLYRKLRGEDDAGPAFSK